MKPRVLFVDDDHHLLAAFKRLYRKVFDVHCADCGETALALIEQQGPFSVIVSDHQMEQETGVELLTLVQSRHPSIYRILLSGNLSLPEITKAQDAGIIDACLAKPCDTKQIVEKVFEAVASPST